jgi:hypothetical protein
VARYSEPGSRVDAWWMVYSVGVCKVDGDAVAIVAGLGDTLGLGNKDGWFAFLESGMADMNALRFFFGT